MGMLWWGCVGAGGPPTHPPTRLPGLPGLPGLPASSPCLRLHPLAGTLIIKGTNRAAA